MDDKAKDFVECFLCDMLGQYIDLEDTNLDLPEKIKSRRCLPADFHEKLLEVVSESAHELSAELETLPVLLCWSADLFNRFAKSVCLMLIEDADPEFDFLNVMLFMIATIYTCLSHHCYRWFDEIPKILETLLKEHLETKFYEEDGFDAILEKCRLLKEDGVWDESTLKEVQHLINDSYETELEATRRPLHDELFEKRTRIYIDDPESDVETLRSNEENCPFCDTNCISFFRALFEPRIVDKESNKQIQ